MPGLCRVHGPGSISRGDSSPERAGMARLSEIECERRAAARGVKEERGESGLLGRYESYVQKAREEAEAELGAIDAEERYERFCLAEARDRSREASLLHERRSTTETRAHACRIAELEKRRRQLLEKDADAFFVAKRQELSRDIEEQKSGRLIDTGYVARARKAIASSLDAGIPVYLVGHLGSGKTQLAVEAAEDYSAERARRHQAAEAMAAWRQEHASATRGEAVQHFDEVWQEASGKNMPEDFRPYLVSGSHNLTAEDLFSEKSLVLSHAGMGKGETEALSQLLDSFRDYIREHADELSTLDHSVKEKVVEGAWKTYSDLAVADASGFGTVVKKVDKEVLLALRQGRPVIIDEMNAIAMPNLIALNDILQHHAGQEAYVAGVGKVEIKPGFCLIGTGNLSTQQVSYEGTNALNPAFQSRFTTIVYNYVPQATEGTLKERTDTTPSELFRLIVEHLLNEDGSLDIPDAGHTLELLWQLAELARMSQNIFEGVSELGSDADTPTLSEGVLSIRNLMHVLDFWNQGEEVDLSLALWDAFLSTVTNADDRNLLLGLAVRYGFFQEADGWKVPVRARGAAALGYEDIRCAPYVYEARPLEHLSVEDVVYLLFGNGPARTELPEDLAEDIQIDGSADQDISVAEDVADHARTLGAGVRVLDALFPESQE